ncbi:hypothetical protein KR026_003595 [Drosophila bipectinata]|nr:hypothetical protein KR026_003595 [Drosophila bipectinata]
MSLPVTKATSATATHAVVQAVETYIQNQNLLGEIAELDEMLCDLVDLHKDNELALKRVLQCIHNLLQTNSKWNVRFGPKLFHKLVSVVIADSREDTPSRRQLVANLLICVQLHGRKFPRIQGKFVLQQLWALSLSNDRQPHAAQILVHLVDDFVHNLGTECGVKLLGITQTLLQSQVREDRRSAYFLMSKLKDVDGVLAALQCSEQNWNAYVGILENLEEQQSHLVLPTLGTLMPRLGLMASNHSEDWRSWLRILSIRLLNDNNSLVLRWTIKYLLANLSLNQLSRLNLVTEFVAATNRTQLYNPEVPDHLTQLQIKDFMAGFPAEKLLEAMVTVQWHCVPLFHWLMGWSEIELPLVPKELLLGLSSRIRSLQNPVLRGAAIKEVIFLFRNTINALSLSDYLMFMESLYNTVDEYTEHHQLIDKIENCPNLEEHIEYFSKRCAELITRRDIQYNVYVAFLEKIRNVPMEKHGWWRLVPIFLRQQIDKPEQHFDFYRDVYKVDCMLLESGVSLDQMQSYLLDRLGCRTREEKSFVRENCVDLFVKVNVPTWDKLKELNLKPTELLDQGTDFTFAILANILAEHKKPLEDVELLPTMVSRLDRLKCREAKAILQYSVANLNDDEYEKCVVAVLEKNTFLLQLLNCESYIKAPKSYVLQRLLAGETTTGDARIERAFENVFGQRPDVEAMARVQFIRYSRKCKELDVNSICLDLLNMNNELSRKKPRYFANSKEHRRKMRIAKAILDLSNQWMPELWDALLCPSDQLNISFMYEYLVAKLLPTIDPLLDQLKNLITLKPSQQVSLISVVHIYCLARWDTLQKEQLTGIFSILLPLTMGANFQTRLFAQLVLHRLATNCIGSSLDQPIAEVLKNSIEATLGDKLAEFQKDARLLLPELEEQCAMFRSNVSDAILWMTNAPFDENISFFGCRYDFRKKVMAVREFFQAKRGEQSPEQNSPTSSLNGNVQRKMNPIGDIYPGCDFENTTTTHEDRELIVVASLIDKLPNLGGLARTCDVLGVRTLILGLKSQAEKSDFTNLSMTAEKTLNIIEVKPETLGEFLIGKQLEGYKIVGAEQTAHSTNFTDFKFPKKCILLLGHEKHGIPADLIGFLDFAVEIPQFGTVRSLNVHVTGSLFIWEYCKQHLAKNN